MLTPETIGSKAYSLIRRCSNCDMHHVPPAPVKTCKMGGVFPANIDKLELDPIPEEGSPGYAEWAQRVHWYRRANEWTIHVNLVHVLATYTVSKLGGLARSPSKLAVKEMKHLLCWFYENRDKGITFGGKSSTGVNALTPKDARSSRSSSSPPARRHTASSSLWTPTSRTRAVTLFLNGGPIKVISRMQHSIASDITDSEAYGFGIAAVIAHTCTVRHV